MTVWAAAAILVRLSTGLAPPDHVTHQWPEIGWALVEGATCAELRLGPKDCEPDDVMWFPDVVRAGELASPPALSDSTSPRHGLVDAWMQSSTTAVPNDPYSQPIADPNGIGAANRALLSVRAFEAWWDIVHDAPSVRVGIIDTGVQLDHPDLLPNLVPGIDLVFDDTRPGETVGPEDEYGHGTFTGAEVCAVGNNGIGIAGIAWTCQLAHIRVFPGCGGTPTSRLVSAVTWATANGLHVLNMSLSCLTSSKSGGRSGCYSQALFDALAAFPGFVAVSAGNNGVDTGDPDDPNTLQGSYPCAYSLPNILCVAASNSFGNESPASFTNWGSTVDLAAPGVNVWGPNLSGHTCFGPATGGITTLSGTSMSAPLVAGVGVLLRAVDPNMTGAQIAAAIMAGVAPLPLGVGWEAKPLAPGAGRLDAYGALVPFVAAPAACPDLTCAPTEDCRSCPADCPGRLRGRKSLRYCCGNGVIDPADAANCGENP